MVDSNSTHIIIPTIHINTYHLYYQIQIQHQLNHQMKTYHLCYRPNYYLLIRLYVTSRIFTSYCIYINCSNICNISIIESCCSIYIQSITNNCSIGFNITANNSTNTNLCFHLRLHFLLNLLFQ